jgi:hypothetical protein
MKAISLWQPFASFMAMHLKWNETRGRLTHYRGELAICSAKRGYLPGEFGPEVDWFVQRAGDIWHAENKLKPRNEKPLFFPRGYVVAVVDLHDCKPAAGLDVSEMERMFGDYSPGRFAWITRECRPLKNPVPVVGHQGFFNLPADVESKVREQL